MHNKESVSPFNIACIGGGSLNWATKCMGEPAYDHASAMFCKMIAAITRRLPQAMAGLEQAA